jgi:quaternary ammonium compound-resistance protein SugE
MPWLTLTLAGLFEVAFTYCLKRSETFRRPVWTGLFVGSAIASLWLLNLAVRTIPLGTAYAVWTGIGAAGTALLGIVYFWEPANPLRVALIALLIVAVVGLRVVS